MKNPLEDETAGPADPERDETSTEPAPAETSAENNGLVEKTQARLGESAGPQHPVD